MCDSAEIIHKQCDIYSNSLLPLNIRHVCDRLKKTKKKQITNKGDTLQ